MVLAAFYRNSKLLPPTSWYLTLLFCSAMVEDELCFYNVLSPAWAVKMCRVKTNIADEVAKVTLPLVGHLLPSLPVLTGSDDMFTCRRNFCMRVGLRIIKQTKNGKIWAWIRSHIILQTEISLPMRYYNEIVGNLQKQTVEQVTVHILECNSYSILDSQFSKSVLKQ